MSEIKLKGEDQHCSVTLLNSTSYALELDFQDLTDGKFTDNPVGKLAAGTGQKLFTSSGRYMSPTGTEGVCRYRIGESGAFLELSWKCPYGKPLKKAPKATLDCKITPTTNDDFIITGSHGEGSGVIKAQLVLELKN